MAYFNMQINLLTHKCSQMRLTQDPGSDFKGTSLAV